MVTCGRKRRAPRLPCANLDWRVPSAVQIKLSSGCMGSRCTLLAHAPVFLRDRGSVVRLRYTATIGAGCRCPACCPFHSSLGLSPHRLDCGLATRTGSSLSSRAARLPRQTLARCRSPPFTLERTRDGPRALRGGLAPARGLAPAQVALRFPPRFRGSFSSLGRPKFHAGAPRLREATRNRILRRARSMLALANVVHFFANDFSGLCARRLPFFFILPCLFHAFFLWHA